MPIPQNIVLDTYKIAVKVLEIDKILAKKNLKHHIDLHLKDLIKYFNVTYTLGNNHRAYVDALVTGEIFFKMKNGLRLKQLLPATFDTIQFVNMLTLQKEVSTNVTLFRLAIYIQIVIL